MKHSEHSRPIFVPSAMIFIPAVDEEAATAAAGTWPIVTAGRCRFMKMRRRKMRWSSSNPKTTGGATKDSLIHKTIKISDGWKGRSSLAFIRPHERRMRRAAAAALAAAAAASGILLLMSLLCSRPLPPPPLLLVLETTSRQPNSFPRCSSNRVSIFF